MKGKMAQTIALATFASRIVLGAGGGRRKTQEQKSHIRAGLRLSNT